MSLAECNLCCLSCVDGPEPAQYLILKSDCEPIMYVTRQDVFSLKPAGTASFSTAGICFTTTFSSQMLLPPPETSTFSRAHRNRIVLDLTGGTSLFSDLLLICQHRLGVALEEEDDTPAVDGSGWRAVRTREEDDAPMVETKALLEQASAEEPET
uniref:Uncharacterized protein n=1 Tax=Oryza punctata TaxID=4537 RepID=A0A0E0LYT9_ORYPU